LNASVCHAAWPTPNRNRLVHPEIRIANPEFRIDRVYRCICARAAVAKDTFGSACRGQAIISVAIARNAPGPSLQACAEGASGCVERGRARRVLRGRYGKGRVM